MAKIFRTTNLDARALVADDGRAYQLPAQRRAKLREQHAGELPELAAAVESGASEPWSLSGREPIIDCVRPAPDGDGFSVTTGDFREIALTAEQVRVLLGDE